MVTTYRKIEGAKAKAYLTRINAGFTATDFDISRSAVHARELSFLNGWSLVEISDATALPEKKCIALDNGLEAVPLEYNENFIVEFCKARGLRIDRHMAADYLKFWLEYLRIGPERFSLIESIDEIPWNEEPTPTARKFLSQRILPVNLLETTPTNFMFKACVLFRDALFDCIFDITYNGNITIKDRKILVEDLNVTDTFTGI